MNTPSSITTPSTVSIDTLVCDDALQVRTRGLNNEVVERYRVAVRNAQRGAPSLPPITVARLNGLLLVADGFHRRKAHELEAVNQIAILIIDVRSMEEAEWIAASGNLLHGLPLTRPDRREAFRRFIKAKQHTNASRVVSRQLKSGRPGPGIMSLGEIASALGASKSAVRSWMQSDFLPLYEDLYRKESDGLASGEHLEPYAPYRGDPPALVAKSALVNAGAALEQLSRGEALNEFVAGLAMLIARIRELHGPQSLEVALAAGWNDGWCHRPLRDEADF